MKQIAIEGKGMPLLEDSPIQKYGDLVIKFSNTEDLMFLLN